MYDDIAALVLAAGSGTRFGQQKQFIEFYGKPLWTHIYEKICKLIPQDNVVVVGVHCQGGVVRSLSVKNGLEALTRKNKHFSRIIILEAARPLVTIKQMEEIINDKHESSTYVLPLVSTIIKKDGTYLNRDDYYKMSTPVAFNFDLFCNAFFSEKYYDFTDDTRVMYEHYGIKPYFIEGAENLFKLTYQSDLPVLETLYLRFKEE